MTPTLEAPPADALCGWHAERAAVWVCPRCGAFACAACAYRVRPDALPMCPACWSRRGAQVAALAAARGTGLQTASMVLGVLSLLPIPPVQLVSLGVAVAALLQTRRPDRRGGLTLALVGLGLTVLGLAADILLVVP